MATYYLVDNNDLTIAAGDEVTFQLTSSTTGAVPVTIPSEVFGTNNQFTLTQTSPSATRSSMTSAPMGTYDVSWLTDEEEQGDDAKQKQHNGSLRVSA